MRMVVQIRAYDPNTIIQQGLAGELFFWSLTAFLSALAVGYTLRKTMTELFCIDSFLP
jgi:hypothetical protein